MDEYDDNLEPGEAVGSAEDYEDIGALLKRLRGRVSLREVARRTGVSASYLSLIGGGGRSAPASTWSASWPNSTTWTLSSCSGGPATGRSPPLYSDEAQDVERAYRFVLDDPAFRMGTRPDGPMTLSAKRFIVEMYEKFTGKRLLE